MDIAAFTQALTLAKEALEVLKKAKDSLPSGPKKEAAERALADAERSFKIAEAQAAKDLGYVLCQCTWPPQIMLRTKPPYLYKCGKCGYEVNTSPVAAFVQPRNPTDELFGL